MNRVTLIGHLGADPEMRFTQAGAGILSFRVATTERWKDQRGERQERTEWHRCQLWGKRAEALEKILAKGKHVAIEGSLRYGKYEDKEGVTRYTTEINVTDLELLTPKGKGDAGPSGPRSPQDFGDDEIPF